VTPPPTTALLRQRTVALLLAAELTTSIATAAAVTAIGWQAYARSGDPLVLGLLGLAEFAPAAVLALPAGTIADRHDRRRVAVLGLTGLALVLLGLALDGATGDRGVLALYALAVGLGATQAFLNPAFNPLLAAAVPAESLAPVIALSSSAWQSSMIVGPVLAGVLQHLGDPAPFVAAAASAVVAAALLAALPSALGTAHVGDDPPTFRDSLAGIRLILRAPALFGAISLDLVAVLFGGATALLPVFARDILHVGATGNGLLRAAPGIGAVLVGAFLAARPLRRRVGPTLFAAVAAYGLCTIVFGLSRSFALSLIALAALAAADMVSVLLRGTFVPLLTPPALRGRVGAVERVFVGASNELGAFESGVAAALIGAVPAVIVGGVVSLVVSAVWSWRFPTLRRADRFEDIRPVEPET
jgi:MFS family permease